MSDNLFVYCPNPSNGARDLVKALGATRLRNFDGMDFWSKGRRLVLPPNASIVNWGGRLPLDLENAKVLNGGSLATDKLAELRLLQSHDILIPSFYTKAPKLLGLANYIPRRLNHMGGHDLLSPPEKPGFWTGKLNFRNEYRIHSFSGKSIKAGRKVPRAGFIVATTEEEWKANPATLAHPWWRSYDSGWCISYEAFKSSEAMRKLASRAVRALGLTFGAVDIATSSDDDLYVLEVNKAPGIEGNTIDAYIKAINAWQAGKVTSDDVEPSIPAEPVVAPIPANQRWVFMPQPIAFRDENNPFVAVAQGAVDPVPAAPPPVPPGQLGRERERAELIEQDRAQLVNDWRDRMARIINNQALAAIRARDAERGRGLPGWDVVAPAPRPVVGFAANLPNGEAEEPINDDYDDDYFDDGDNE